MTCSKIAEYSLKDRISESLDYLTYFFLNWKFSSGQSQSKDKVKLACLFLDLKNNPIEKSDELNFNLKYSKCFDPTLPISVKQKSIYVNRANGRVEKQDFYQ